MEYTTLSTADKLTLARDTLRARESDHFRFSLVPGTVASPDLSVREAEIEALREEVSKLEAALEDEQKPDEKPKRTTRRKSS